MVGQILKLENLLIAIISVYFFSRLGITWAIFLLFVLFPDLGMVGYLKNTTLGFRFYNLSHTYLTSSLFILIGWLINNPLMIGVGLIFCFHIGLDRFLGFGLKYPTGFKDTHMQKV